MNIADSIAFYQKKLDRKRNLIKPLREKQNLDELTSKELTDLHVLDAEINLIEKFIDELEALA